MGQIEKLHDECRKEGMWHERDNTPQERETRQNKKSELLVLYNQKGDVMQCENYSGIKLLQIELKVYEKAIEERMRERGELPDNQFAFRPGRCTMNAVFIIDTIAGVDIESKVGEKLHP